MGGLWRGKPKRAEMRDPATYRRYAQECRRLASTMPQENRRTLLEIAEAWSKLAEEAERQTSTKDE
jgi:hypothetical protein